MGTREASCSVVTPDRIGTEAPAAGGGASVAAIAGPCSLQRALERAVLDDYTPAGMVVRENGHVVFLFGPTGKYLAPSAGPPSLNATSLVRQSLRTSLRVALHQAARTRRTVTRRGLAVGQEGSTATVDLTVRPFNELGQDAGIYLVILQDMAVAAGADPEEPPAAEAAADQMQYELRATRERLQLTIDELESANQELQSANEDLLSMNEELQSANEELQSSKEETLSVNGELEAVNGELTHKVGELDTARSDLESLFEGTQIATVFLDNNLCIKRFTPTATELFRLRQGDAGRPVTDITRRFTNGDMTAEIREVLRTLQRKELPVAHVEDGRRYLMRITPYRTRQNVIDGVAIAFVDVTELKRTEDALREARQAAEDAYERERRIAVRFQRALLPAEVRVPGYRVAHSYRPALDEAEVGGDFYNVVPMDERRVGLVVGDVGGKGLGAAAIAARAQHSIAALSMAGVHSPGTVLTLARRVVSALEPDTLVTVFFAVLEQDSGRIEWTNAGHEPGLLWHASEQRLETLLPNGPAIFGVPAGDYCTSESVAAPGDLLYICTDGLTEARPMGGQDLFGLGRASELVRRQGTTDPAEVITAMYQAAVAHSRERLHDDIVQVALRRGAGGDHGAVWVEPPGLGNRPALSTKRR